LKAVFHLRGLWQSSIFASEAATAEALVEAAGRRDRKTAPLDKWFLTLRLSPKSLMRYLSQ
jgi:hypothetical protein